MNLLELETFFEKEKVPKDLYSLKGGLPNERLCIGHVNGKWEVYYSERGHKTGLRTFDTEEEACLHLYEKVKRINFFR